MVKIHYSITDAICSACGVTVTCNLIDVQTTLTAFD